jgi:hypothetical protein
MACCQQQSWKLIVSGRKVFRMNVSKDCKRLPSGVVALFFLMIATVAVPVASQSKELKQAHPVLELTVSTDRSVYRMADTLNLQTQLLNSSDGDVYIWSRDMCWNPVRGFSLRITAPDGSLAHGDILLDCVPPPPRKGDVYAFLKLEPQNFHGRASTFKVSDLVNKPGEYDIEATFNSFLSETTIVEFYSSEPISKLPLWTMEKPTVTARRIHITVKP